MEKFEPRPYQENYFKQLNDKQLRELPLMRRGRTYVGIDLGEKDGDKTVIARATMNGNGITSIVFDEYADMPDYKWYRNPIKWWKWRRLWKTIEKQYGRAK